VVLQSLRDDVWPPGSCDSLEFGFKMLCANGHRKHCFPVLSAWLADHMEHVSLQNIYKDACPICDVGLPELGEFMERPAEHRKRNHDEYKQKWETLKTLVAMESLNTDQEIQLASILAFFREQRVKLAPNIFWNMPFVDPAKLHKGDLLHAVYLGDLAHLIEWILLFLKKYKRLELFDAAWQLLPLYPSFYLPKTKSASSRERK
ncbi:hypothetical protein RUND412_007628, partial [Rhizina undulata]